MPDIVRVPTDCMADIAPLFQGWEETMIWSCLQGNMGRAWADVLPLPRAAKILVGDFCFLAGTPHTALAIPAEEDFSSDMLLLLPQHDGWEKMIETAVPFAQRIQRYALCKDSSFDIKGLAAYAASLPHGYTLHPIDEKLYNLAGRESWSRDLCSQFPTYAAYKARGLGYMALENGVPVCGASSYTVYDGGIEIEVDTRKDHRRKGLALVCAARLMLACLEQGLYPSWDAATPISLHLAEKLGYKPAGAYTAYMAAKASLFKK